MPGINTSVFIVIYMANKLLSEHLLVCDYNFGDVANCHPLHHVQFLQGKSWTVLYLH